MLDESFKSEADRLTANIQSIIQEEAKSFRYYSDIVASLTDELQNNKDLQNDRSENNSYVITKENRDIAQAMVNTIGTRIESLKSELIAYKPTNVVTIGTTLALRLLSIDDKVPKEDTTKPFVIKVVNHATGKASAGLIANDSPVGIAVLGKSVGDTVTAIAPGGRITYKIERMY